MCWVVVRLRLGVCSFGRTPEGSNSYNFTPWSTLILPIDSVRFMQEREREILFSFFEKKVDHTFIIASHACWNSTLEARSLFLRNYSICADVR